MYNIRNCSKLTTYCIPSLSLLSGARLSTRTQAALTENLSKYLREGYYTLMGIIT